MLMSNGAKINAVNDDGETPLHTAVQHIGAKPVDCITALLDVRADPCLKDSEGHDAFAHARISTNRGEEITAVLRQSGASADMVNVGAQEVDGLLAKAYRHGKM